MANETSRPGQRQGDNANDNPAENPLAPTPEDFAEVAVEGDANNAAPVRRAAIIENQRIQGGHPDGSAPPLDRLIDAEAQDDQLNDL